MKKISSIALCAVIGSTVLLGGCVFGNNGNKVGEISQELIALSQNAQYLPSRDMLVTENVGARSAAPRMAGANRSNEISPEILLDGGISADEYDALIDAISPIDTPFNRDMTVLDAKNEVTKVLSSGVLFNEWFSYTDGDLRGTGRYYVTNENDALTVTRLSCFQPWVYEASTGRYLDNDDFSYDKPNYPFRSDNYLKISIYTENGKEVVECEVVENLSCYDEVTLGSYQLMRNVKDESFTKIQVTLRGYVPDPDNPGGWGYDIDTELPYGYIRSFTQLDYSSPDDIKWLTASQTLPYAFDLSAGNNVEYGCRSEEGGFYYKQRAVMSRGQFSYTPSDEYLTAQSQNVIYLSAQAQLNDASRYYKDYSAEENGDYYYVDVLMLDEQTQAAINEQMNGILDTLKSLAKSAPLTPSYDCTAENTTFEEAYTAYFNAAAKRVIDGSALAQDNKNNTLYEFDETRISPATIEE